MLLCAVFVLHAATLAADPFEPLKSKATEVESTTRLLEAFGGGCDHATDPMEAQECRQRGKKAQQEYKGKDLYLHLGSDLEGRVQVEDVAGGKATLVLTPVFDLGAGVALTFSKPRKLDANGTIIVSRIPVSGILLDDALMASDVRRLAKTGSLALEVVGQVKKAWTLKKKGGGNVTGVEFKVKALRFSNRRGGKPVLSQVK